MNNEQYPTRPPQCREGWKGITHYSLLITHCFCGLVGLLLLTVACTKMEENGAPTSKTEEVPDQESWNSKIILSEDGIVRCIIDAGHLQQFETMEMAKIDQGMTVDFFDEQGEHTSRLTAREGKVSQKTKDLHASGDVVIVSDDGVRLVTQHIRWDNARQKILAPGEVTLSTDQGTETGVGLEADAKFAHWTMREVTGHSEERFEKLPQSKK